MQSYRLERVGDITIIRLLLKPNLSRIEQIVEELEEKRASLRLWDFSVGVELTSDELRTFATRPAKFFPAKTAVLSADDLAFGLARMYEVHSKLEERFNVFREENDALDWLANP
jgi:hypothetical protein